MGEELEDWIDEAAITPPKRIKGKQDIARRTENSLYTGAVIGQGVLNSPIYYSSNTGTNTTYTTASTIK